MFRKKLTFALLTFLLSSTYLSFYYSQVLKHPNNYLFTNEGDGLKTYYHFLYYAKHDTNFLHLNGISYPFGENQLFEDSLPFLSNSVSMLSKVWPGILDYQVGILNLIVLLSIVMAALFLYLILCHFAVPHFWAMMFGTGIAFLSSQVKLLNPPGHFGLSMVCFFPMGWYLLLKWIQKPSSKFWSILIACNVLFWNFFHVYLGMSLLMFNLSVYFLLKFLKHPSFTSLKKNIPHIIFQFFIPISIIFTLVFALDTHPDRINLPFIDSHRATWKMIFFSDESPFKFIYSLLTNSIVQPNLSWSRYGNYIGLGANLFIMVAILIALKQILVKQTHTVLTFFSKLELSFLFSSILILFFSFAIPIGYFPTNIQNSIPFIKQFSALGRFAWVFYYVITTLSVVFFYQVIKNKYFRNLILFILITLLFIETYPIHKRISHEIQKSPNSFHEKYLSEPYKNLTFPDTSEFQAIIPLPSFFKFNVPISLHLPSDSSIFGSMIASVHTGLPIVSTYLSRPSISETMQLYSMLMPLPYYNSLIDKIPSKKDFSVLVHKTDIPKFDFNEKELLKHAKCIDSSGYYYWYRLPYNYLESLSFIPDSIKKRNVLEKYFSDTCLFHFTFDTINAPLSFLSKGAYVGNKKKLNQVIQFPATCMDTLTTYNLRFWYYNYLWDQTFTTAIIIEKDSTNRLVKAEYFSPLTTNTITNWWYLTEHSFQISSPNNIIELQFSGIDKFKDWFVLDELTIVPLTK